MGARPVSRPRRRATRLPLGGRRRGPERGRPLPGIRLRGGWRAAGLGARVLLPRRCCRVDLDELLEERAGQLHVLGGEVVWAWSGAGRSGAAAVASAATSGEMAVARRAMVDVGAQMAASSSWGGPFRVAGSAAASGEPTATRGDARCSRDGGRGKACGSSGTLELPSRQPKAFANAFDTPIDSCHACDP